MHQEAFALREMVVQSWPILSILLAMSCFSITIIVDRYLVLRRVRQDVHLLGAGIADMIKRQGYSAVSGYLAKQRIPVASIVSYVISQGSDRDARDRALRRALQEQIGVLERRVPILGTIAATAPFIGLFGTVTGLIKSFSQISTNMGGGPEVVAAGVAEALITTAAGLVVAIPAVMGFNYCAHQVRKIAEEVEFVVYDAVDADERRSRAAGEETRASGESAATRIS